MYVHLAYVGTLLALVKVHVLWIPYCVHNVQFLFQHYEQVFVHYLLQVLITHYI